MTTCTTTSNRRSLSGWLAISFLAAVALPLAALAQSGGGAITGRVFNPATHEYIRNAEVRIEGTPQVAISEDGGYYRLDNAPAGTVTVTATYTGHESAKATVNVTPGATATHDFELAPTGARASGDEPVRLAAFVVETEREGQAKAVSEQRNSMNVKTVMSADNFGDMSEGNIGEFLKYMPGIVLDYVETDTRAARMGGMDARYGYVTLDGNTQASGGSGGFGDDSRQFEFESVSMNNIESIEVNKTLSADMSADAPAGTVNLRTRSAFDLKRAKYGYSIGLIANSLEYGFRRTPRHDDGLHAKTRPRFSFDYTNSFFDHKLGITLNGAFTNIYKEQFRNGLTYDYTSTQAQAAGHPLITAINFKDGPKIVEKSAGGVKVDYRPFPSLRMSGAVSFSWFNDFFANRNLNFRVSAANIDPASTLTKVIANPTTNANTRIEQSGTSEGKFKDSTNLSYTANYRTGPWTADLSLLYSRQREHRGGLAYGTMAVSNVQLTRIGWTAERSSVDSPSWWFTQTAGPDWSDFSNYGRSDPQTNNTSTKVDDGLAEEYTAKVDLKRAMSWEHPTIYKFGLSERVSFRHRGQRESFTATYVGPTGSQLTSPLPQSTASFLIGTGWDGNIEGLPVPDKEALNALHYSHPEYFLRTEANRATDLDNMLGSFQGNQETIKAAYVMQETRLGQWRVQAGLRDEMTSTISRVPDEVPVNKNPYATFTTNATTGARIYAAANTQNFVLYRYSLGTATTYGSYSDLLPSASAKYQFTKDLSFKFGYNKAIKRPNLNRTAGGWDITTNGTTGDLEVTIPNPGLRPERSNKYSAMVEYYFEPACSISAHVFQTDITDAADETDPVPASEFGYGDDPFLSTAFFTTFVNLNEKRRVRGIELSYSQQMTFFRNELLKRLSVFGSYSQYTASPRPRNGKFATRNATGGVSWNYRKFAMSVNGTWTDEIYTPTNTVAATSRYFPNDNEFLKDRLILFVNLRYKLTTNTSIFVSGDRAYDSGKTWYFKSDGRIRQMERYGSQWSVGLRGDY